jgi:hypothetical protein
METVLHEDIDHYETECYRDCDCEQIETDETEERTEIDLILTEDGQRVRDALVASLRHAISNDDKTRADAIRDFFGQPDDVFVNTGLQWLAKLKSQ